MRFLFCLVSVLAPFSSFSFQDNPIQDTVVHLESVKVQAYFGERDIMTISSSVGVVGPVMFQAQSGTTLLPAINTIPGVRMEERSPGSYRLSIRGSLLRSPFGIRNVKVYMDEIPLTDAGGNTYLNALDPGSMDAVEVLKGPDGSVFGANSGGVLRINPVGLLSESRGTLQLNAGSYGLFHQQASLALQPVDNYRLSVSQAHQQSTGFRENTAMRRDFFQTAQRWSYQKDAELRLFAIYSDMQYRTPGGLTAKQYEDNPKGARPATPATSGAVEQQAGIFNKTLWGGLVNEKRFNAQWRHIVSVFGTKTDFKNPFITNYEVRDEYNYGFRTYVDYVGISSPMLDWGVTAGVEWQVGENDVRNYDNHFGQQGGAQAFDVLRNRQHFYFARLHARFWSKVSIEAALSLNQYQYAFRSLLPSEDNEFVHRYFQPAWMPRVGLVYLPVDGVALRATVSKGYSPPTTAEIRSSDNVVNRDLNAETGWNYEAGVRWKTTDQRFYIDASVFYYHMRDAIVRQLRDTGAEFFQNAGGVQQRGLEVALVGWLIRSDALHIVRGLHAGTNVTVSRFRFSDYKSRNENFSGNKLTGVPGESIVSHVRVLLPEKMTVYIFHNYTSSIPLNDANTVSASHYDLVQTKMVWEHPIGKQYTVQLFAGIDNLLNQKYSLGNDINAFGGRFFNVAMPRNYYGGIRITYL